jgi:hypothetical protein
MPTNGMLTLDPKPKGLYLSKDFSADSIIEAWRLALDRPLTSVLKEEIKGYNQRILPTWQTVAQRALSAVREQGSLNNA